MRRGSNHGVHEFWCQERYVFLVNTLVGPQGRPSPYIDLAPTCERCMFTSARAFQRAVDRYPHKMKTAVCIDDDRRQLDLESIVAG